MNKDKLRHKYQKIQGGNKVFWVPVKPRKADLIDVQSMAFDSVNLQPEFDKYVKVDYESLIKKILIDKAKVLLVPMKLEHCLSTSGQLIKKLFG